MKKLGSLADLGALVYSTDGGRHCPDCNQPESACVCAANEPLLGDGRVRVRRESKGRGGKTVTLISGLPQTASELKETARKLKQLCGVGGAVKEDVVEIQGDQVERILAWLNQQGFQAKKSGG